MAPGVDVYAIKLSGERNFRHHPDRVLNMGPCLRPQSLVRAEGRNTAWDMESAREKMSEAARVEAMNAPAQTAALPKGDTCGVSCGTPWVRPTHRWRA